MIFQKKLINYLFFNNIHYLSQILAFFMLKLGKTITGPWSSSVWRLLDVQKVVRSNRAGPIILQSNTYKNADKISLVIKGIHTYCSNAIGSVWNFPSLVYILGSIHTGGRELCSCNINTDRHNYCSVFWRSYYIWIFCPSWKKEEK